MNDDNEKTFFAMAVPAMDIVFLIAAGIVVADVIKVVASAIFKLLFSPVGQ